MYIVFKLKEQQKKAANHYEKCFSPFFSDEFSNDTLPKLLIRKCCLFIWYQNRSFKIIFEVIFLGFVLFNSHLLKIKVNCTTQPCDFKAAPLTFWSISNYNLY